MGQFKICQLVLNVLFLLQIYVCVVIRDFILSLSDNNQADVVAALSSKSRNFLFQTNGKSNISC